MSNSLTFGYCDPGFNYCNNSGGSQGPPGPPGIAGPTGPAGPPGPPGTGGGGTGSGALRVGLSGSNGQVGPSQIETLYFNTDDGFTYTDLPGLTGGGAIIGNKKITDIEKYLFKQPPQVQNHSTPPNTANQITLRWDKYTPTTYKSSFAVAPSSLGGNFDWLPYISDFRFGYQESNSSTWNEVTSSDVTTGNSWLQYVNANTSVSGGPNNLNTINFQGITTSASVNITSPDVTLTSLNVDIGQAASLGKAFRFRFAFINQSSEEPNWVYWPDPSNGSIGFGNFGPPNPPQDISFSSTDYQSLSVNGNGAAPGTGKDASLNTPYTNTLLSVRYGGDVSGNKRSGYKQFEGKGETAAQNISFESNPQTNGPAWTQGVPAVDLSSIAYPEYRYVIELSNNSLSSYYSSNSATDFSNVRAYAPLSATDDIIVSIPTKSQVNANYANFLNTANFTSITISGSSTSTLTAYRRDDGSYQQFTNLTKLGPTDSLSITAPLQNTFKIALNFGDSNGGNIPPLVTANGFVGNDCSGEELSYFRLDISGSNAPDLSSNWKIGGYSAFNNLDSSQSFSNANFSFTVGKMLDPGAVGPSGNIREEGYYLGCDLTNHRADNLTLTEIPDICNNGFEPYYYRLTQVYRNDISSNTTDENIKSIEFSIIQPPDQSLNITDYRVTLGDPNGGEYFYGLELPSTFSVDISFNIEHIHPTWGPSQGSDTIWKNELFVDPAGINKSVDESNATWASTTNATEINVQDKLYFAESNIPSGEGDDYKEKPFSRDMSAGNQISTVSSFPNNNIGFPSFNIINNTDLSWNTKPLWWDYTWAPTGGPPSTTFSNNVAIDIGSGISNVQLCDPSGQNPFTCDFTNQPGPPSIRNSNFQDILKYNEAMWAKDKWYGSNVSNTTASFNPYIDYTTQFYNTFSSGGTGLRNYSSSFISGDNAPINKAIAASKNYTPNQVDLSGNNDIKWIMIKFNVSSGSGKNIGVNFWDDNSNTWQNPLTTTTRPKIYDDLVIFYMEKVPGTGTTYTWGGNTSTRRNNSPWLDAGNISNATAGSVQTFQSAASGTNNGCCLPSNINFIQQKINTATERYIAIGIFEGNVVNKIRLTVGNN